MKPLMRAGVVACSFCLLTVAAGCTPSSAAGSGGPALIVGAVAVAIAVAFLVRFETSHPDARQLAVVALLGTLSALLRVPFAAIPNFQPSTYLVICSGYVYGPVAGFMVGMLTAVVSNFFLGQGPWTLFQVVAWGLAGASAFVLRRLPLRAGWLVLFGVVWGGLFGLIMNVWNWVAFVYPLTPASFLVTWFNSLAFDAMHAVGNALLLGLLGARTVRVLERYHRRFHWERVERDADGAHTWSERGLTP